MTSSSTRLYFAAPPLPYFIESGESLFMSGDQHPNRNQMGIFDLLIVESGCLFIGEEHATWALTAGQTLLLTPDRYHYSEKPCEQNTHFYWIHFHTVGEWQQIDGERAGINYDAHTARFLTAPYSLTLQKQWTLPYPEQAYLLMHKLNKSGGERQSSGFWTRQQSFEELLRMMDLRQDETYTSPAVTLAEKAEAYIKNNYRTEITSQTMSQSLNFHYNYITRCMKQVYGMTPADYLTFYRLEQAKLLLLKTEWPVAAIAEQVGYDSTPYFSNCFSQKTGISPSRFRKQFMKP